MRAELFGVDLDLLNMDQSVQRCVGLIESGSPAQHVVINAGKVVMMHDLPRLREVVAGCDMVNADGQSIVWVGRMLGLPVPERVAGIDLMVRLLAEAATRGWPVFFLGARRHVLDEFLVRVREQYPGLLIVGAHDGYFDDPGRIAGLIRDSGARLVLVGISSPLKEFFLSEQIGAMGPVLAMGVGGSFDVIAGHVTRAPRWMQAAGLEWLHRFLREPGRLWKRYLIGNARFLAIAFDEWRARRWGA